MSKHKTENPNIFPNHDTNPFHHGVSHVIPVRPHPAPTLANTQASPDKRRTIQPNQTKRVYSLLLAFAANIPFNSNTASSHPAPPPPVTTPPTLPLKNSPIFPALNPSPYTTLASGVTTTSSPSTSKFSTTSTLVCSGTSSTDAVTPTPSPPSLPATAVGKDRFSRRICSATAAALSHAPATVVSKRRGETVAASGARRWVRMWWRKNCFSGGGGDGVAM